MARFSATLCCKYVRYNRADETTTNTRQMMAIPTYLNILLITIHSLGEPSLPWDRIFVPSVPPPSKHSIHLLLRVCVNLRPSVVVQNRVDFSSPQLWTKLIQKSLPSGSHLKNSTLVIVVGAVPMFWTVITRNLGFPWRGPHLNHVGVSLHHQLRTIRRDLL